MNALTVYKASAGSGKTFTLAVQYIKLLLMADEGNEYSRILAVTFTNKATTEMKDRILSQLYGIGHSLHSSGDYLDALRKSLKENGVEMSDDEIRRRCRQALHQILHDYNRFRVQTIDAFFQSILRGLAHELGLTANLQVEISDTEVLSKAVDRIFDRLQDQPVLLNWVMSLVTDQIENNQRWDITKTVKSFGSTIFNEDYLMRGDKLREVLNNERTFQGIHQQIKQLCDSAKPNVKQLGESLDAVVKGLGANYGDFSNGHQLAGFADKLKKGEMDVEPSGRLKNWALDPLTLLRKADQRDAHLVDVADQVSAELSRVLETYQTVQYSYNSSRLVLDHLKKLRLLINIDEEVAQINSETSRFNLAKTPILLNRMIGDSDAPFIFEKIGAKLKHVMIDEFQDTSRLQWSNFRSLLLESYAKGGSNLLVGDVKQSIYRWRGGDWRMLAGIEDAFTPAPKVENLDTNYRSLRHVIDFNNAFFKDAASAMDAISKTEIEQLGEPFSYSVAYADAKQEIPASRLNTGHVNIEVLDSKAYKSRGEWEPAIVSSLIEQVRMLHDTGLPYEQMTILIRNNNEALPIIDAFSKEPDMPAIVSNEAFMYASSSAILSLITALRLLDNPADRISEYYLSQKFPDAMPLDEHLAELPLYDLLEKLYRILGLSKIQGQDAYLMSFFDAVTDYVHQETSDFHSFLRYWDETLSQQSIPAGQVEGIRVITIHKAKGLEFHTVLIPFCTWAFESSKHSNILWCTPTEEPYAQLQLVPVSGSKLTSNSIFATSYAREHLYNRFDELNTLYVAFTRARCNLFVWAVGTAEQMGKASRTVGDLVASLYPDSYDYGVSVVNVKADEESDNRLLPHRTSVDVAMSSFPLTASFRQSNQSQQFLADQADAADAEIASIASQQQQYLEMGRLLHGVLQQIVTEDDVPHVLDALEQEGVIIRTTSNGTYVSVRRTDLEEWIHRGLQQPQVASWFSHGWQLFTECSIVSIDPSSSETIVQRPDRVMISNDGRQVVVVDFKFGRHRDEYNDQVLGYMNLLQEMYPEAHVEGYLWYVYSAKVKPVRQSAPRTARPSTKEPDNNQLTLDF